MIGSDAAFPQPVRAANGQTGSFTGCGGIVYAAAPMSFLEIVARARAALQRNGRVSLRALTREYSLDETVDELAKSSSRCSRSRAGTATCWSGWAKARRARGGEPAQPSAAASPAPAPGRTSCPRLRRAPAAHRDVLRPRRLDRARAARRPRGAARDRARVPGGLRRGHQALRRTRRAVPRRRRDGLLRLAAGARG